MDTIRDLFRKPLFIAGAAFIVGILLGWLLLGWMLFPVEWTDATPDYLRQDIKAEYLRMAVDSYSANQDTGLAKARYESLGSDAADVFKVIQSNPKGVKPNAILAFGEAIGVSVSEAPGTTNGTETPSGGFKLPSLSMILALFCGLSILLAVALFMVFVRRKRVAAETRANEPQGEMDSAVMATSELKTGFVLGGENPIAQFMTTYMAGDEQYDDSFSIDTPMGDFLGECGVGISDTIGVGEPKKISAFEVWLFDKNDIQTVTKVVMSDHIYNDPNAHQRLLAKGEPVLAAPGKRILLETQSLQLEARIVDMNYGQGALPAESYFDRMTLELRVWSKQRAE